MLKLKRNFLKKTCVLGAILIVQSFGFGIDKEQTVKKYEKNVVESINLGKEYDFSHSESRSDWGRYKWNLMCVKLICEIKNNDELVKEVNLKDYKQKNDMVKKIVDGMANLKGYVDDYYRSSTMTIYKGDKKIETYSGNVMNENFFEILDEFLGKKVVR